MPLSSGNVVTCACTSSEKRALPSLILRSNGPWKERGRLRRMLPSEVMVVKLMGRRGVEGLEASCYMIQHVSFRRSTFKRRAEQTNLSVIFPSLVFAYNTTFFLLPLSSTLSGTEQGTIVTSASIFPSFVFKKRFSLASSLTPSGRGGSTEEGMERDGSIAHVPLIEPLRWEMEV